MFDDRYLIKKSYHIKINDIEKIFIYMWYNITYHVPICSYISIVNIYYFK